MSNPEIFVSFDVDDSREVQVLKSEDGTFNIVEVTKNDQKVVQHNLDALGVIRYLANRIHNIYFLLGKLEKKLNGH